jgi:hypothetical protein
MDLLTLFVFCWRLEVSEDGEMLESGTEKYK